MDSAVTITSAHDGTTLDFFDFRIASYKVKLKGPNYEGTASVYAHPEFPLFDSFFRDLAQDWSGWKGEREWGSLEGEFRLCATIDSTGHVDLMVKIKSGPYPYDWSLTTTLVLESGQLAQIARQIERFVTR
jgi:hypothetical protein